MIYCFEWTEAAFGSSVSRQRMLVQDWSTIVSV